MNNVKLSGNVGGEFFLFDSGRGKMVSFSIAVNQSFTNKDNKKVQDTQWYKIVALGKTADACEPLLCKGKFVEVEGKLQKRKFKDKENNIREASEILIFRIREISRKEVESEA